MKNISKKKLKKNSMLTRNESIEVNNEFSKFESDRSFDLPLMKYKMNETISLSPKDSLKFAEAILNPPEPKAALRKAAKSYQKFKSSMTKKNL